MSSFNSDKTHVLDHFLPLANMYGWSFDTLIQSFSQLSIPTHEWSAFFPRGMVDVFISWQDLCNQRAIELLTTEQADNNIKDGFTTNNTMRVPDKILYLVTTRLSLMTPYRNLFKTMLTEYGWQLGMGSSQLWQMASEFWYAVGDTATDFNYYTKRGLLAWVYISTLTYWLAGHDMQAVQRFARHRIDEVLMLGKLKRRMLSFFDFKST